MIPWYELERHLRDRLTQTYLSLAKAKGEEIYKLQGRAELLQELHSLPEILTDLAETEEESKNDAGKDK